MSRLDRSGLGSLRRRHGAGSSVQAVQRRRLSAGGSAQAWRSVPQGCTSHWAMLSGPVTASRSRSRSRSSSRENPEIGSGLVTRRGNGSLALHAVGHLTRDLQRFPSPLGRPAEKTPRIAGLRPQAAPRCRCAPGVSWLKLTCVGSLRRLFSKLREAMAPRGIWGVKPVPAPVIPRPNGRQRLRSRSDAAARSALLPIHPAASQPAGPSPTQGWHPRGRGLRGLGPCSSSGRRARLQAQPSASQPLRVQPMRVQPMRVQPPRAAATRQQPGLVPPHRHVLG